MHEIKLTYGEQEGRLIHVNNVENGIACKCVCPGCGQSLIARNKGKVMRPHFAHHQMSDCLNGAETALHRMAKQLIAEHATITTPSYNATVCMHDNSEETHRGPDRIYPSQTLVFDDVVIENDKKDYRVDVTGFYDDTFLHIEIKVTHAVDDLKQQKVIANNEPMIEVDLSDLSIEVLMDEKAFEEAVLSNANNKHWIFHPEAMATANKDKKALELVINKANEEYRKQSQEGLKIEKARIREQKELEEKRRQEQKSFTSNVLKHREPHELDLRKLYETLSYKNTSKRDEEYTRELLTYCNKHNIEPEKLSPYIHIRIDSDWIFGTHPFIWQNYIHEQFLHNNRNGIINAANVLQGLSKRFTIPDYVKHLSELKAEYKRTGKARGKTYGDYGCWFFSTGENSMIPSPWYVVQKYLEGLKKIGFLTRSNENKFDFIVKFEYSEDVERDVRIEQHRIQNALEEQKRIKAISIDELKEQKRLRVELIILSEQAVFEQHNGDGVKCNRCLLVSMVKTQSCPFCGGSSFKNFRVTEQHLKVAFHKYKCHPSIRDSLFDCNDIDTTTLLNKK